MRGWDVLINGLFSLRLLCFFKFFHKRIIQSSCGRKMGQRCTLSCWSSQSPAVQRAIRFYLIPFYPNIASLPPNSTMPLCFNSSVWSIFDSTLPQSQPLVSCWVAGDPLAAWGGGVHTGSNCSIYRLGQYPLSCIWHGCLPQPMASSFPELPSILCCDSPSFSMTSPPPAGLGFFFNQFCSLFQTIFIPKLFSHTCCALLTCSLPYGYI